MSQSASLISLGWKLQIGHWYIVILTEIEELKASHENDTVKSYDEQDTDDKGQGYPRYSIQEADKTVVEQEDVGQPVEEAPV